jgi:para-nitrobenzyl esterase
MSVWHQRRRSAALRRAALLAALGLAAAASGCGNSPSGMSAQRPQSPLEVGTADGQLRGKQVGTTDEYSGIPYAAPPVGALRWAPPKPPAHWHGTRSATAFAPHCPQPVGVFGRASTTENCLYLNVFRPAGHRDSNLPVMVWIHGGGYVGGESDDYNPSALVANGVIVVTINYRLGALGFLADAALASHRGGSSGDYGLMDQQAALRWVQRNIRAFGGNPANVTIFGESAGGQSVLLQLISPTARGLFAKAIVESGGYAQYPIPLASAEAQGKAFAAKVGCPSNTAQCLRKLPVATILANENQSGASADIDGVVLTQQTIASTLFVTPQLAALIAAQYPLSDYPSPALAMSAVGTDAIFACPTLLLDQDMSKYTKTYAYEFNDENAPSGYPSPGFAYAATHAAELQYLFGLPAEAHGTLSAQQRLLATAMQREWTSFAKSGVPSAPGAAFWPRFTSAQEQMLSLIPPDPVSETDFSTEHHCSFWALGGD